MMNLIKHIVKYLAQPYYRKRIERDAQTRLLQDKAIQTYPIVTSRLIVFMVPGLDAISGEEGISGGVMSIVSLTAESARLEAVHGAKVILVTLPGHPLLLKHHRFQNEVPVFRWEQLSSYFTRLESIIVHIPEYASSEWLKAVRTRDAAWWKAIPNRHINILNQNIELMPTKDLLLKLIQQGTESTITTAHQQYCTPEHQRYFGIPLHKLSVWISPEKYQRINEQHKEPLLVVSPDGHPRREEVMQVLHKLKGINVQVIEGLTYEAYKELIGRARYSLTFGEGLDGYLIEPVFSGSIAFAVYNEQFFTPDFKHLPSIYKDWDTLMQELPSFLEELQDPIRYRQVQEQMWELCAAQYSYETYLHNLERFYRKQYSYPAA